jgi:tellurite resistance protein TerC
MTVVIWASFVVLVVVLIALDLGVLHRRSSVIGARQALVFAAFWVALALAFNVYVYFLYENNWLDWGVRSILDLDGREAALQFFTGYLVEFSLSVDNVFVIATIFVYMRVPPQYQYRILFWGILGAIVLRGIMIGIGATLIHRFDWITYVFGAILIWSATRLMLVREDSFIPEEMLLVQLARKFFTISPQLDNGKFFTVLADGRRAATPLFVTLLMVEAADVMFAVDSVPAIFAVTVDPFLVFTSNVFAILGLRTLYFVVAGMMNRFRYLKVSLVFILGFVGLKMILSHHYPIPNLLSLGIIIAALLVGVIASARAARN